jgi:hypothetical protein
MRALHALILAAFQIPAATFSFDGVSLQSDFRDVAARYSHSTPQDQYVSLDPRDIHDHISMIEVSGTGRSRRVRIAFETRPDGQHADYPTCAAIEARLVTRFGRPQEIRRFYEEASARADRIWRSPTEELTLICFTGARRRVLAEAVQITPR